MVWHYFGIFERATVLTPLGRRGPSSAMLYRTSSVLLLYNLRWVIIFIFTINQILLALWQKSHFQMSFGVTFFIYFSFFSELGISIFCDVTDSFVFVNIEQILSMDRCIHFSLKQPLLLLLLWDSNFLNSLYLTYPKPAFVLDLWKRKLPRRKEISQ